MTQQLHPWQNNEKFRSLDPKKQEMILQLTGHLQGHTITEATSGTDGMENADRS